MLKSDSRHMLNALEAAQKMRGHTWPNPSVGCVLVDPTTNEVIAAGCTQQGGKPHAEMHALAKADDAARGAVAYVTLEPCNHKSPGKPVSCTDGLIKAGISAAVIAIPDPDPRMRGASIDLLKHAGIDVHVGLLAQQAYESNAGFITRVLTGRPRITLKLAHSTNGKIGIIGTREILTGPASWQDVFALRGRVDAVMVGIGTALADDPQLTDRRDDATLQPVRIVVDSQARLPLDSKLTQSANDTPVWLLTGMNADTAAHENAGIRIIRCPEKDGRLDLSAAMKLLAKAGLNHILCEGGAALTTDLLAHNLIDDAWLIEAPVTLEGNAIPLPELDLKEQNEKRVGDDVWRYYLSEISRSFCEWMTTNSAE